MCLQEKLDELVVIRECQGEIPDEDLLELLQLIITKLRKQGIK